MLASDHIAAQAQREALERAITVYRVRYEQHGDLWKDFGWEDLVFHIRNKASRVSNLLDRRLNRQHADPKDAVDSVLDLINYCGFFLRMVENGEGTQKR